jgi:hypothetical protein
MAVDAVDVFQPVDRVPVLVYVQMEGNDLSPLVFRQSLVIVAVQAILGCLGRDRPRQMRQDQPCDKEKQNPFPLENIGNRRLKGHQGYSRKDNWMGEIVGRANY